MDVMWSNARPLPRYSRLLAGLILYGFADALMVQAAVGIGPWDVLAQGVSLRTGLLFGLVTNLIGLLVLLLWIPLRQRPGIGTVLNVLLIGTAQQATIWLIPTPDGLAMRALLFTGGLLLLAVATGIYVGAALGAGPRDGLMTGLHSRLGWPIWVGRTLVEVSVLIGGWLLDPVLRCAHPARRDRWRRRSRAAAAAAAAERDITRCARPERVISCCSQRDIT
jgi:uncharacterized membrane protein YczE